MKYIYQTNKIATFVLLLISLTFWGGIIALPVLGLIQIIMCIIIFLNLSKLNTKTKRLFYGYIILTIVLAVTFKLLSIYGFESISLLFKWMVVSALLACLHLYSTYKINNQL